MKKIFCDRCQHELGTVEEQEKVFEDGDYVVNLTYSTTEDPTDDTLDLCADCVIAIIRKSLELDAEVIV